jgi:hypothetical protein
VSAQWDARVARAYDGFDPAEKRDTQGRWTKSGAQLGSNPGGVFTSAGQKHYIKFYANPDQGRSEALASALVGQLGVRTTMPHVESVHGKEALVSPWIEAKPVKWPGAVQLLDAERRVDLATMYYAAVLTKNWDVLGIDYSNIAQDAQGHLVQLDLGGAFEFRAQGQHKDYDADVSEKSSLMREHLPSGAVFNQLRRLDPKAFDTALERVRGLDSNAIEGAFVASGLKNSATLARTFFARRAALIGVTRDDEKNHFDPDQKRDATGKWTKGSFNQLFPPTVTGTAMAYAKEKAALHQAAVLEKKRIQEALQAAYKADAETDKVLELEQLDTQAAQKLDFTYSAEAGSLKHVQENFEVTEATKLWVGNLQYGVHELYLYGKSSPKKFLQIMNAAQADGPATLAHFGSVMQTYVNQMNAPAPLTPLQELQAAHLEARAENEAAVMRLVQAFTSGTAIPEQLAHLKALVSEAQFNENAAEAALNAALEKQKLAQKMSAKPQTELDKLKAAHFAAVEKLDAFTNMASTVYASTSMTGAEKATWQAEYTKASTAEAQAYAASSAANNAPPEPVDPKTLPEMLIKMRGSSGTEASRLAERAFKMPPPDPTPEIIDGVVKYTGGSSINDDLRRSQGNLDAVSSYMQTYIRGIDTAMQAVKGSPRKLLVARGLPRILVESIGVGDTMMDHAYCSTSFAKSVAHVFSKDGLMHITIPKGFKFLSIPTFGKLANQHNGTDVPFADGEAEALLPRGTVFKITKVTKGEGELARIVVHATAVSSSVQPPKLRKPRVKAPAQGALL